MDKRKTFIIIILILSALGILDASYLIFKHYSNSGICIISETCDIVLMSKYSKFLGMPVALFGLAMYAIIFAGAIGGFAQRHLILNKLILLASFLGVIFSAYFTYVQAFTLKAWCEYCVFSAVNITVIFVLILYLKIGRR